MLDISVNAASSDIDASTYGAGTIVLSNTGTKSITSIVIDLSSALFTNASSAMVFDPTGAAGDETAKGFTVDGGTGNAVTSELSGGSDTDGYTTLTLTFDDLAPGDALEFSIDIDPNSIQGAPGAGDAGSVSGLELTGAVISVSYADGTISSSSLFADGSLAGAVASVPETGGAGEPAAPVLSVDGSTGALAFGNAAQTVTVSGTPGETVTVVIASGALGNGVAATSLFDTNTASDVAYQTVVIGAGGTGTFDVTLPDGQPLYIAAAAGESGTGDWGAVSAPLALALDPALVLEVSVTANSSGGDIAVLDVAENVEVYGDRDYWLSEFPEELANARLIHTNNDSSERTLTIDDYITFTASADGYAYVAYDPRQPDLPEWLASAWVPTGLTVTTIETHTGETPQSFNLFGRAISAGEEVLIGGADGFSGGFSNLFVFVDDSNLLPAPDVVLTELAVTENDTGAILADIDLVNIVPAPTVPTDFTLTGADADLFEVTGTATDGFQLKLVDGTALDFEAISQPSVTVTVGGVPSALFTPAPANDYTDDAPQGEIEATIVADTSVGEIVVVNAVAGAPVYGDRDYTLQTVPTALDNARMIVTNNDGTDRGSTAAEYVSFQASADGFAYVAYDSRATVLPDWLTTDWTATGEVVTTLETYGGLSTQTFNLYGRAITAGETVTLGGADESSAGVATGAGFSNLFAFVDDSDMTLAPDVSLSAIDVTENVDGAIVADIAYVNLDPAPTVAEDFELSGDESALFEVVGNATDGFQLKLIAGNALDFEAGEQPSVTITVAGVSTEPFTPSVLDDITDNPPQGPIDASVFEDSSVGEIAVINAFLGAPIYGDRDYTLDSLPAELENARLIRTNNDLADRDSVAEEYVTFSVTADGFAYVAYDARATVLPNWLTTDWTATGAVVTTEENFEGTISTQTFNLYGRAVTSGESVTIGGADAANAGVAPGTGFSNLFAFVDDSDLGVSDPAISLNPIAALENVDGVVVADIVLTDIDGAALDTSDFTLGGDDAALFEVSGNPADGFQLKLITGETLDFEAGSQPNVTVSAAGVVSDSFSPSVSNDPSDDPSLEPTILSEDSYADIAVIDAGVGAVIYGDRDYTLDSLPAELENARLIRTNNDSTDRDSVAEEYVTFSVTADGFAYVAYDARATVLPNWLTTDWTATGAVVTTEENFEGTISTQTFNLYGRAVTSGESVTIGGADAANAGVAPGTGFSNLFAFVDDSDLGVSDPAISLNPIAALENVDGVVVADIVLTDIDGAALDTADFTLGGDDAALFEVSGNPADGFQLKLITGETLDFEAGSQPNVTVSAAGVVSDSFSPSVSNDPSDDPSLEPTILSEDSYADITVVDAGVGAEIYGDRDYTLTSLPTALENARLIQTNNSGPGDNPTEDEQDRFSDAQSGYVVFDVNVDSYVYVAYDVRATTLPAWLQSGWVATGETVTTEENFNGAISTQTFNLYGRSVPAGEAVDIGGADRGGSGGSISNLFVFVDDSDLGVGGTGSGPLSPGNDVFFLPEDSIEVPLAVELNDPENTTIIGFTEAEHGTVELIDGVLHYTPDPEYSNDDGPGTGTDSFTYTIENADGDTGEATVSLTVTRSHEQPQADIDNWDLPGEGSSDANIPLTDEQRAAAEEQMQDLAPEISPSGMELVVSRFAQLPGGTPSMLGWATVGDRMFVQAQDRGAPLDNNGVVYEMVRNEDNSVSVIEFFNIGETFNQLPVNLEGSSSFADGVRGFAFHPEFLEEGAEGYGKFYFSGRVSREPGVTYEFVSEQPGSYGPDSAVIEFTYDFDAGEFDIGSYREVMRIGMNTPFKHPIKDIMFNPYAEEDDDDYGNLYVINGDGSANETAITGQASQGNDAIGKVLRINPLETAGGDSYSVPDDNPFVGDSSMIDEVYALGLRNEHDISFYQAEDGEVYIILTGVGYDHADEVNVLTPGANLGWGLREGVWVPIQDGGNTTGLLPLPEDDWLLGLTYPATFVAHDPQGKGGIGNVGDVFQALAGGHVINNGSELDGHYIFADFAESSRVYHVPIEDLLAAKTTLEAGEDPSALTWATPSELTILYNSDNDTTTTPIVQPSFMEVVNDYRSDVRFGEGPQGELYIMNKRDGWIYIVENSTPEGFELPTGVSQVVEPPEIIVLDALGDYFVTDTENPYIVLDDGSNAGLMNNDGPFPGGGEPSIVSVNGIALTENGHSTGRLSGTFEGSNGGLFTVAAGGAMRFEPNGDFAGLADNESTTTAIEYTILGLDGSTSTATVVMTVKGDPEAVPTIENFVENSGQPEPLTVGGVQVGNPVYADRDYTFNNFPDVLFGAQMITTNNDDRSATTADLISFTMAADGFVYVALDARRGDLPSWVDGDWNAVGQQITILGFEGNIESYNLYGKAFEAGELVTLGGNEGMAGQSHYLVAVSDVAMFLPEGEVTGNAVPTAQDGTAITDEDAATTIDLSGLIADAEDGTPIVVAASSDDGTVTIDGSSLIFTPEADFNGEATISYTVEDSAEQQASAEIDVTVTPVNDAPEISGSLAGVTVSDTEGTTVDLSGLVLSDVDDPAADLTLGVRLANGAAAPAGVEINGTTLTLPAGLGSLSLEIFASDGDLASIGGIPLAVNGGSAPAGLAVTFDTATLESYAGAQDGSGTAIVGDGGSSLQLDGNLWKRAPLPQDYTITENTRLEVTLDTGSILSEMIALGFDIDESFSDSDGSIYYLGGTQPYNAFIPVSGTDNGDGTTTFVIDLSAHAGTTIDSLVFVADDDVASDGRGAPTFSNVLLIEEGSGGGTNTPPISSDPALEPFLLEAGTALDGIDLAQFAVHFSDADPGDTLTLSAEGLPDGLSVDGEGVIIGTPTTGGEFTVTIRATDTAGASATLTIELFVEGEDEPAPDVIYEAEDAVLSGDPAVVGTGEDDRNQSGAFVDFLGPDDETISWSVTVAEDGTYGLEILYALGAGKAPRPMQLSVDGTVVDTLPFIANSNADESIWGPQAAQIDLTAGTHTISVTAEGGNGPNIDFLRLSGEPLDTEDTSADEGAPLTLTVVDASDRAAVQFQVEGLDPDIIALEVSFDGGATSQIVTLDPSNQFIADVGGSGEITATLTVEDGAANTASDSVTFTPGAGTAPNDGSETVDGVSYTIYEAENALLDGPVIVSDTTDERGQSGGGFVDFDGSTDQSITWTVSVTQGGTYAVDFLYALRTSQQPRPASIAVNGVTLGTLPFAPNSNEAENQWGPQTVELQLDAGISTITITAPDANGANIDYLRVSQEPVDTFAPAYAAIDGEGRIELEATDDTTRTLSDTAVEFYFTVAADGTYALDLASNAGAPDGGGLTLFLSADGAVPVAIGDEAFPGTGEAGESTAYLELQAGVEYELTVTSDQPGASALDYLDVRVAPGDPDADIAVQSLDAAFFDDRLHFSWIDDPDVAAGTGNDRLSKTSATVEISNTGTADLTFIETSLTGPFELADPDIFDGLTLGAGESIAVEVLFDRDAYTSGGDGVSGVYTGALSLRTNDADTPLASVDLAGFWQARDEGGQEPNINEVWDVFGFGNEIEGLTFFGGGENDELNFYDVYLPVDDTEVLSPYWRLADGVAEARITQIAAYHQPAGAALAIHAPGNKGQDVGLTFHDSFYSQSLLPLAAGGAGFATATFTNSTIPDFWAGTEIFGIEVDDLSTDPTLNPTGDGAPSQAQLNLRYPGYTVEGEQVFDPDGNPVSDGYTVRIFQAVDTNGAAIENVFLGVMDYTGINYDYNDNMFIIEGITPVGEGGVATITGLDAAAADDRLVMSRIDNPANGAQTFRDTATFTLTNDGIGTLDISNVAASGPFTVSGLSAGDSLAEGQSVQVTVTFTGSDPVNNDQALSFDGTLVIDTSAGERSIALAGLAQWESEGGEEPSVAQIVEAFGYSTDMAQALLANNGLIETVGDEVIMPYLQRLDGGQPVEIFQIGAYLQQGDVARLALHDLQSANLTEVFAADDNQGQTVLPDGLVFGPGDTGSVASGTIDRDAPFGLHVGVDGKPTYAAWGDPVANDLDPDFGQLVNGAIGQGHLIRYFQARDAGGAVIEGTYIGIMDYPGAGNYDYNDFMFVIQNVQPYALTTAEDADGDGVNDALALDGDNDGIVDFFDGDVTPPPGPQQAYTGTPWAVDADGVTVEARFYDTGGQGVAYNDLSAAHLGDGFRGGEGVDISFGTLAVGYTEAGEWLEYTIDVAAPGTYALSFNSSSPIDGRALTATFAQNGVVYESATSAVPNTGAFTTYADTAPQTVTLNAGTQVLRVNFDLDQQDLASFTLSPIAVSSPQTPFPGPDAPTFTEGVLTVDASNYDDGGQGVAYNDSPGLAGGSTNGRTGSDVEQTGLGHIGWIEDGEWLEYTIEVPEDGLYDLDLLLATPEPGRGATVAFYLPDAEAPYAATGGIGNPPSSGYTDFQPRSAEGIALQAGSQIMRVTFTGGSQDFASFSLEQVETNAAPVAGPLADAEAEEGGAISLDVAAAFSDPDLDTLSFTATGLPAGLSISPTGQITGTAPQVDADTDYTVTVTATDPDGLATSSSFTLSVADVPVTGPEQAPFPGPDAPLLDGSLTVAAANFDSGGQGVSWNDDPGRDAPHPLRGDTDVELVGATNDIGYVTPGEWVEYTINVAEAGTYALGLNAKTPIGGNSIAVSLGGGATLASFDLPDSNGPDTGFGGTTFAETPTTEIALAAGEQTLRFTFDGALASNGYILDFRSFSLEQVETNAAPVAGPLADAEAEEGGAISLDVAAAFSDPDLDTLSFTATGLPAGLSISPTGQITGTAPQVDADTDYTVTVTATDPDGLATSSSFTLSVADVPVTGPEQAPFPGPDAPLLDGSLTVAAANFDSGGQGVSWNDDPGRDAPHPLRGDTDVELVGATNDIGYVTPGECVEYTINVAEAGTYALGLNAKTPIGGNSIAVSLGGGATLASFDLPDSNGPDTGFGGTTFAETPTTEIALAAGEQTLRFTFDGALASNGYILDFRSFSLEQVETNAAPVAGPLADAEAEEGGAISLDVAAAFSDPDLDTLSFTATGLPAGLSISPTGQITGTAPQVDADTDYTVTVTATDPDGLATSSSFTLSVADVPVTGPEQAPFPGPDAPLLDGSLTVAAANFDSGGQGVSWNDDPGRDAPHPLRGDTDVELVGATNDIGYVTPGEWVEYTINVAEAGTYALGLNAKTPIGGNSIAVSLGGGATLASFDLPDSNGPDTGFGGTTFAETPTTEIALAAGEQTLRFTFDGALASNGYILDFRSFSLAEVGGATPVTPPEGPAPSFTPVRVEAEAMDLAGFSVFNNGHGSGDQMIQASGGGSHVAGFDFTAASGVYDFTLGYFDESDGQSSLDILVNGEIVDSFVWDADAGSALVEASSFAERQILGLELETGDRVELSGTPSGGEPLRVDFLEYVYTDEFLF